jgi:hypothetical protein
MAGRKMPSKHLAAPAAFQANDIIATDGSPDRHRGCSLTAGFCDGFAKPRECLMYGRNQGRELIGCDLIAPNIRGDNFGREFSID